MITIAAIALGVGFLLIDRHLPAILERRRPSGLASRLFAGRPRTDP